MIKIIKVTTTTGYIEHQIGSQTIEFINKTNYCFVIDDIEILKDMKNLKKIIKNFIGNTKDFLIKNSQPVYEYCVDYAEPELLEKINIPEKVWNYVDFGNRALINKGHDNNLYIILECECAWEIEHGLQLVLKNGNKLTKVGPYDGYYENEDAPPNIIYVKN